MRSEEGWALAATPFFTMGLFQNARQQNATNDYYCSSNNTNQPTNSNKCKKAAVFFKQTKKNEGFRYICESIFSNLLWISQTGFLKETATQPRPPPFLPHVYATTCVVVRKEEVRPFILRAPPRRVGYGHNVLTINCAQQTGKLHHHMYVTACLAGQNEDVEVGENCCTLQALKEALVAALPQLCVEGFDVSVGGRALDSDEGVVSLEASVCLDVSANGRGLSVLALREAGREVSEAGLLQAATEGSAPLCRLYLDAGVPADCADSKGRTPLHRCSLHRHLPLVTLLLDRGSTAINEKDIGGHIPLHFASAQGDLPLATLLLSRGSVSDVKNGAGATPLHLSCDFLRPPLVRLLLDRGSCAGGEKDDDGQTPLHVACCEGSVRIAELLLDRGSAAIDEKGRDGETPLHIACRKGRPELAALLLDRGSAAIDEKDDAGQTPLHAACSEGSLKIATLLLNHGSTAIDEEDGDGHTPLHVSCSNRRLT